MNFLAWIFKRFAPLQLTETSAVCAASVLENAANARIQTSVFSQRLVPLQARRDCYSGRYRFR